MNNVLIRLEQPGDQCAVEALTRDAFWNVYKPGCDEHLVALPDRHFRPAVRASG